jgi:hypothetical protein
MDSRARNVSIRITFCCFWSKGILWACAYTLLWKMENCPLPILLMLYKDPGPEGPALVHPGGVMKVATSTSSVQVFRRRRIRCQQLKSTRWIEVAHEMDFLSPVLTVSPNPISVQDSGFVFTDTWNLTPETMIRSDRWQSRSSLTWPTGPGFRFWIKKICAA